MKVYEAVLDQLLGAGVSHFAGMVGSTSAPYASALAAQNQARYVGIRHEQVAAAILDATARLSGQPGCLMVHGGSGLLAASLGIGSAALDCTPMVVTQRDARAEGDGKRLVADIGCPEADCGFRKVSDPCRAAGPSRCRRTRCAPRKRQWQTGRGTDRHSHRRFDRRAWHGQCSAPVRMATPHIRSFPDPGLVEKAADLLARAQRPVLLIGGGANYSGAGDA